MRIYDISLSISPSSVIWPGDAPVTIEHTQHLSRGDHATVSHLCLSAHTGTHIDAPCHFVAGGHGIDDVGLDPLVGPALVVQAPECDLITANVLDALGILPQVDRLLLKTRNSSKWSSVTAFDPEYVAISPDGAMWLIEHGVRLIGLDYLSVAPFADTGTTHRLLLEAGIIPLEGLNLASVLPGWYELYCLPLSIAGGDGAPARAILIDR